MKFDLSKIKNKLLVKYPFFGNITANVKYIVDNSEKTACTDGTDIYYNEEFMNKLTEDQQVFILAHEVCHIAFNHIKRMEKRDMDVWNIVTDAVINAFLQEDKLPIVEGGIDFPWASEYNADDLYEVFIKDKELLDKIKKALSKMKQNVDSKQGNGSSSGQSQGDPSDSNSVSNSGGDGDEDEEGKSYGHDSHSRWKKVKKQEDKSGSGKDKGKDDNKDGNSGETEEEAKERRRKKRIENEQEAFEEDGEKKSFEKNRKDKKEQLEKMRDDINKRQVSHQAGTGPATYQRQLGDIGRQKQLIDWRKSLRDSITYDYDWSYKNASIEDNIVKSNLEGIPHAEVEIVLDTSGSIDAELLRTFLRECKNIMLTAKIKVGCFDTEFYGFHTIRNENDINNLEFAGGGGTNFDVAVGAFTRKVVNKIIFTDGYANMPKETVRCIWVVFGDTSIKPKGGKVIPIDYNELMKKRRK